MDSLRQVITDLKSDGYSVVQTEAKLTGKTYILDHQCVDMLAFPYDQREAIEEHNLVKEGHIVLQVRGTLFHSQAFKKGLGL